MGNFRIFKLKRGDLNLYLEEFLAKFDATRAMIGYPSHVFISDEDAAVLRRNNRKRYRKQQPDATKHRIDHNIGSYWLQYGPSSLLGKIVRPGYVMVDIVEIDKDARELIVKAVLKPTLAEQIMQLVRRIELGGGHK
jgi:hypothetical protein